MSNSITVLGFVCDNVKRYNNDDGSVRLYFAISSKTQDYKRRDDKTARDFWNCDLFVPSKRAKFADYIVAGKCMSVSGIPYKSYDDQKREFTHINAMVDMVQFVPTGTPKKEGDSEQSSDQEQAPAAAAQEGQAADTGTRKGNW